MNGRLGCRQRGLPLPPRKAAKLVAGNDADTDEVAADLMRDQREADALKGKPVPKDSATDLTTDSDEEALKPVVHTSNNRSGGA